MNHHDDYMDLALRAAREAMARGDWPTGSVIELDGAVVGTGLGSIALMCVAASAGSLRMVLRLEASEVFK